MKPETIIDAVCEVFEVTREEILSDQRPRRIADPRMVCYFLVPGKTCDVGEILNRDHRSVSYGRQRIREWMEIYPEFRRKVESVANSLCQ